MRLSREVIQKLRKLLGKRNLGAVQPELDQRDNGALVERPTRSFVTFFEHLKKQDLVPEICIDVGAATGTETIYEAFPRAKHVVFEPLPDFQDALRRSIAPYDAVAKECALSDKAGERTLLRHSDLYGSSIMHHRKEDDERVVTVRTSTLDIELAEFNLANRTTLLKTDCQGSDLLVLKGGLETLKHCDIVLVEASMFRFWGEHQADFYDILKFMNAADFALYDILDGLYRPLDSALGQLDLAFAKKQGPLRRVHYW